MELLTTYETAAYLRVPRQTLASWRHKQVGPSYMRIGKHILYSKNDLVQWVAARRITHPEREGKK
jgi:excisionase family DNA binding protein